MNAIIAAKRGKRPAVAVPEGCEIRGVQFRIYPTGEQIVQLRQYQEQLRRIWNWNVKQSEDCYRALESSAVRLGLVERFVPWAEFAARCGLDADGPRDAHRDYCAQRRAQLAAALKGEKAQYRSLKDWCAHFDVKHPYQLFQIVRAWGPFDGAPATAFMLQALEKSIYSKGAKRYRRKAAEMPLCVRSGDCLRLGDFGGRGKNPAFYNAEIKFGVLRIRGRLHRDLVGRLLQGVSLREEADGWYASVKQVVPKRLLPEPTRPPVGVDLGLVDLAATSDGRILDNVRGREFAEMIAGRQALGKPVGRLHLRARRHMLQQCYEAARELEAHSMVAIEKLPSDIGQRGSVMTSAMRTLSGILRLRLGPRLREVDPSYTSQECSQCGYRSKESWAYENGRYGQCPQCGYREHRDINAARNILAKALKDGAF